MYLGVAIVHQKLLVYISSIPSGKNCTITSFIFFSPIRIGSFLVLYVIASREARFV